MIKSIAHASFLVADLEVSLQFYRDVLKIAVNQHRPNFPFDGAWLDINDQGQQIHLMKLPNPDVGSVRPDHGGKDKHVALVVDDFEVLTAALDAAAIAYSRSKSGRAALFCRDPDGNAIEFAEEFVFVPQ